MNTNEMDDFELFGGEAPVEQPSQKPQQSQQGGAPQADPSRGSRSTLAETAAAVARRKKESERTALMHEIMLIGGFLLVLAVGWFVWRAYMNKQAEMERIRHEYEMQEQQKQAEIAKAQREEAFARQEKLRKEREAKALALKKEVEARRAAENAKRLEMEKANAAKLRIKSLLTAFRGAEIDYYKNAMDAERPDKVGAEALFVCLMPGGGSGYELYEVRTKADGKMDSVRLTEKGDPEPVEEKAFGEMLKSVPSLILRDRGQDFSAPGSVKAYLLDPTRSKRGLRGAVNTCPPPSADSVFSPAREDFGALYDVARSLGCSKTAFKYKVYVRGGGLADPVFVKEMGFGEEIGRAELRDAVKKSLEASSRGRRVDNAGADGVLRTARVEFRAEIGGKGAR